jgi:NAD(P)-dependent dehydrogenase (short-subunit alcohol dehydrogenase family)
MGPDGYDLSGRVAIVTGGGEGIGKATAHALARCGADVVIAGRTQATLERTAREISEATGRRCQGVPTDARDEQQVKRLVARSIEMFGRLDILVNGVGWSTHGAMSTMSTQAWKADFDLNVDTAFLCAREAAQHFLARGSGAIVNVSSVAGSQGVMGLGAYSAAKAALEMFTRVAAAEWGPQGVRVNCVAPGLTATDNAMKDFQAAKLDVEAICARFPLRRAGRPEDVANAIVFLASDAAAYITGVTLPVNGGPTL